MARGRSGAGSQDRIYRIVRNMVDVAVHPQPIGAMMTPRNHPVRRVMGCGGTMRGAGSVRVLAGAAGDSADAIRLS